jgi:hypothetical protein
MPCEWELTTWAATAHAPPSPTLSQSCGARHSQVVLYLLCAEAESPTMDELLAEAATNQLDASGLTASEYEASTLSLVVFGVLGPTTVFDFHGMRPMQGSPCPT